MIFSAQGRMLFWLRSAPHTEKNVHGEQLMWHCLCATYCVNHTSVNSEHTFNSPYLVSTKVRSLHICFCLMETGDIVE